MATTDWDAYRRELEREKFNQQIQLANSQQQASRNVQKTLNAQGYGSQGYGATQQAQINNNYQNNQSQLQTDYLNSLIELNQQEKEEIENNANNTFQTFITDTQGLTGDDFYSRAESYGLAIRDSKGNYTLNTNSDVFKNLDQASQAYLQNYFNAANVEEVPYTDANIFDVSSLDNQITYTNGSGQVVSDTINNRFKDETQTVINNIRNGNIQDGDMIKMTNMSDNGSVYLIYDNGNLYYITESYFNSHEGNKYKTFGQERTLKEYKQSNNTNNEDQNVSNNNIGEKANDFRQLQLYNNRPYPNENDILRYDNKYYIYKDGDWYEYIS